MLAETSMLELENYTTENQRSRNGSTQSVTRYLPMFINGIPVLTFKGSSTYMLDNSRSTLTSVGLHVYRSQNYSDVDKTRMIRWYEEVIGIEEGEWLCIEMIDNATDMNQYSTSLRSTTRSRSPRRKLALANHASRPLSIMDK